jgi:hypothetical protein
MNPRLWINPKPFQSRPETLGFRLHYLIIMQPGPLFFNMAGPLNAAPGYHWRILPNK